MENFEKFATQILEKYSSSETDDAVQDFANEICRLSAKVTIDILREYRKKFPEKNL